ncbi:MAG: hypothetical protein RMA76_29680 [Deltaproteobacteria bacterium]|jgi:hypothetical protein
MNRMKTPTLGMTALLLAACGGAPATFDEATSETIGTGSPPIDDDIASLVEPDRLVGIGISGTTDEVLAWTAANTVSGGNATNFAWTRSPNRFTTAPNHSAAQIVANAVATDGTVHTWYGDGTYTTGDSNHLAFQGPQAFGIPGGRTPLNIVGIAIAKPSDLVYAWYDDGQVSVGDAWDLGSRTGPHRMWPTERAYAPAAGRTPADVIDMAIEVARVNRVVAWYRDGYASEGTFEDLDAHRGPFHYTRHGVLKGVYPETPPSLPSGPPSAAPPWSSAPPVSMLDISAGDQDNGVAAGHNFFAVALNDSVRFYTRDGTSLMTADLDAMFEPFKRSSPNGATPRPLDVNHYIGFDTPCDDPSYPTTNAYRYCVSGGAYDTRVEYDKIGRRFVIVAQIRNPLWTNIFSANPRQNISPAEPYVSGYAYPNPPDGAPKTMNAGANGGLARRLKVVAVSRAEDPALGFHTYVFVQNNYRDWPWMSINGDWLVLANRGPEQINGPVATLMSLAELRDGVERPQFVHYKRQELEGAIVAGPARHHGTPQSLLLGVDDDATWRVFALTHPTLPYDKVPAGSTVLPVPGRDVTNERAVYRDGFLHVVAHFPRTGMGGFFEIDYFRIPVTMNGNVPVLSVRYPGFRSASYSDPTQARSYEEPGMQVNSTGDVLLLYGAASGGVVAAQDQVFRVLWPANASAPSSPVVWRSGQIDVSSHGDVIHALHFATDPVDPTAFWAIHKVRNAAGSWRTFVGTYKP